MNTTKKLMALVLAALACMSANAQDHGRENGFGIRLTREMTSKIDVNDHLLRSEVFGDTAFLFSRLQDSKVFSSAPFTRLSSIKPGHLLRLS